MHSIKKILVPTDYSKASLKAINFALELAKSNHGELIIHHAIFPFLMSEDYFEYSIIDQVVSSKKEYHRKFVNRILKKINNEILIKDSCEIGLPSESILECAQKSKIDLIILGTSSPKDLNKIVIGSKTGSIIANSKYPIFLIPQNSKPIKHHLDIVFATDFIDIPKGKGKKILKGIIEYNGAQLDILHIIKSGEVPKLQEFENALKKAFYDVPHQFSYVSNSNPIRAIQDYVAQFNLPILCLIKRNHGIISGIFHQSISKYMALHTTNLMLILPE